MRILILHSRYLSGDVSGENRVVHDEARLLTEAGHEVLLREPSPSVEGLRAQATTAATSVWARRIADEVTATVRRRAVDVVHVHNLFPELSPRVLPAAKRGGAAVVMTLHNFRLMCLPATLERDGRACELCVGRVPWRGVRYGCYRGSRAGSAALATSLTLHRAVGTFAAVDRFLAVSGYVRRRHLGAGIDPARVGVKENFVWPQPARQGAGGPFLFLGRLTPEKGLNTLFGAWRAAPDLGELVVAGDGPDLERLRGSAPAGVRVLGAVPADEVPALVAGAAAVVVPSRWPEPAVPRAVLEAYAAGVGVVAAAVGGIPEGVRDGETGVLVPTHDADAWIDALRRVRRDGEATRLGDGALALWRERYGPEAGLRALERAYEEASAR